MEGNFVNQQVFTERDIIEKTVKSELYSFCLYFHIKSRGHVSPQ